MKKPFTVERPWGTFRQYSLNEPVTVKTVFVKKGGILSLQYHNKRAEFWHILSGTPEIRIGETVVRGKAGDEFEVPVTTQHRISAPDGDVEFLEVSFGTFDELDNTRLEDVYGRAQ